MKSPNNDTSVMSALLCCVEIIWFFWLAVLIKIQVSGYLKIVKSAIKGAAVNSLTQMIFKKSSFSK